MATPTFSAKLPDIALTQLDELASLYGINKTQIVIRALEHFFKETKLMQNRNAIYVCSGKTYVFQPGDGVSAEQMQRIAQSNGLDRHATADHQQDLSGLRVSIRDLWTNQDRGWVANIPQLEAMAARVGAVVQHPGNQSEVAAFRVAAGEWSLNSFFVYPG